MAKITLGEEREQQSSYQLYKQSLGGDQIIAVRRKVAMPSDVEHRSSRETKRQRERFAEASKRWASIPGPVKADLREKYGIVYAHKSPGLSEPKVLQGAQLYTSQEIHQQKYHQAHQEVPPFVCMVLRDERANIVDLPGYLAYGPTVFDWNYCDSYYLAPGNTLFYPIPIEPYYKIGCSKSGGYGEQIFLHTRPEVLEVRHKTVYPYLTQWCSYVPLTYTFPPSGNWKLLPQKYPGVLWDYEVHQPIGDWIYPSTDIYYPEVAYELILEKISQLELRITILPRSPTRPDRITLGRRYDENVVWTITPEGILDPPQIDARVQIDLWHLLGYE